MSPARSLFTSNETNNDTIISQFNQTETSNLNETTLARGVWKATNETDIITLIPNKTLTTIIKPTTSTIALTTTPSTIISSTTTISPIITTTTTTITTTTSTNITTTTANISNTNISTANEIKMVLNDTTINTTII